MQQIETNERKEAMLTPSVTSFGVGVSRRKFLAAGAAVALSPWIKADDPPAKPTNASTPIDADEKKMLEALSDGNEKQPLKLTEKQMQIIWDLGGRGPWQSVLVPGTKDKARGLYQGTNVKTKQPAELSVGIVNGYATYYPYTRKTEKVPKDGIYAVVISPVKGKTTEYKGPNTLYNHEYVAETEPKKP